MQLQVVAVAGLTLAGAGRAVAAERPWVEVRSAHFHVLSDAGERAARDVALRFEQIRAAFASLGSGLRLDPGQPLTVLAARDEKSLAQLLPAYFETKGGARPAGVFIPATHRLFVVLREDVDDDSEGRHSVLFHEYVHILQSVNFRTLPLWLAEGMAEFYAHTTVQTNRLMVGRAAPWHVALLRERRLLAFDEFFAADRSSAHYNEADRASIFYAQAWALTHWLILGEKGANRPRLQKFLERLDAGATPEEAVADALGGPADLRRALDSYLGKVAFYMQTLPPVSADPAAFAVRPLPAGELAAWRALVHLAFERKDDARRTVQEALRLAPEASLGHEASALLLLKDAHLPEARTAAAEAVERDPRSMPALMAAGALALLPGGAGPPEAARLFEAATKAAPQYALAVVALAGAKSAAGAPSAETLELSRRAASLWPSNLVVRFALAEQLQRHGDHEAAQREAERALALATTDEEKAAGRMMAEVIKAAGAKRSPAKVPATPERALDAKQLACAQGDAGACVSAGVILEKGEHGPVDLAAAATLYGKGCDGGSAQGCYNLALVHHYGKGVAKDVAQARVLYDRACTAGHGASCYHAGDVLWHGQDGAKDETRAADYYEKSCAAGSARGCGAFAWTLDRGRGRAEDVKRAFEVYAKACEGSDAISCESLGWAHATGRGTTKDLARAVESFDKACTDDPKRGCVALGQWLGRPEVGRDYARAAKALDRACQAGEQDGCAALAGFLMEGLGMPQDAARAQTLAGTACDKGAFEGCGMLAAMHADKTPEKSVPLWARACDGGLLKACTALAFHYLGGRGVTRSVPKASALLEKACDGGDAMACSNLADLAHYGGGPPDTRRAAALRKKACAGGYQPACGK